MYASRDDFLADLDENSKLYMGMVDNNCFSPFGAYRALYLEPEIIEGVWSGHGFEIDVSMLDCIFYAYDIWKYDKSKCLYELFFAAMDLDKLKAWNSYKKEPTLEKYESGQAKIFFTSMRSFVGLTKQKLKVLVIGSSSESVLSGVTYTLMAEILTDYGYYGEIHLYDDKERGENVVVGRFKLIRFKRFFDFDMHLDYDVILDDSFVEAHFSKGGKTFPIVSSIDLEGSQGKLILVQKGERYHLIGRAVSDHGKILTDGKVLGGASYIKNEEKMMITSNQSGTFGPLDVDSLVSNGFLVTYNGCSLLKRKLIDSSAILNLKWPYDEDLEGAIMLDQYCYVRNERRALFRHGQLKKGICFDESDGCRLCNYVSDLVSSITQFNDIDMATMFRKFFFVCGEMCRPFSGIRNLCMKAYLFNALIRGDPYNDTVNAVAGYLSLSKDAVLSVYEEMKRKREFDSYTRDQGSRLQQDIKIPQFLINRRIYYPEGWLKKTPRPDIIKYDNVDGEGYTQFTLVTQFIDDYYFFYTDYRILKDYIKNGYEEEGVFSSFTFVRRINRDKYTSGEIGGLMMSIKGYSYLYDKIDDVHLLSNPVNKYVYKNRILSKNGHYLGEFYPLELHKAILDADLVKSKVNAKSRNNKKKRKARRKNVVTQDYGMTGDEGLW